MADRHNDLPEERSALPTGWAWSTVAQVGNVRLGRQRSPEKSTGRYATPYLRPANITQQGDLDLSDVLEMDFTPAERLTYALKDGDILIVDSSGSPSQVGRAALWNSELEGCCYQNHLIRFRAHAVIPEYALLVFRHYATSGRFSRISRGVGIQHLGSSRFASMLFPLPPIEEQRRIAEVAQERFAKLQEARAALESALARTFEQDVAILSTAVKGGLASRRPAANGIVGEVERPIPQRRLFDNELPAPQTPLGWTLPPGWRETTVSAVGQVKLGRQRSPEHEHGHHQTPYLRAGNITRKGLDLSEVYLMNFTPEERGVFALRKGDVVLAEASGSASQVGRPAIWNDEIPGCCFQNTVVRFRPIGVQPRYALLVFNYYCESGAFSEVARGLGLQHLGAMRFAQMAFPLPPASEQDRIVDVAQTRLLDSGQQRKAIEDSIEKFEPMRRELLATAVGGGLVDQRADAEPAEALLARLGPPSILAGRSLEIESVKPMDQEQEIPNRAVDGQALAAVLKSANRRLTVPELFAMAGFDRDSTEQVEMFYLAMRLEIGKTIRIVGDSAVNASLEAISE